MSKDGYLLVDLLISILIGMTALIVITELLISLALFARIVRDEIENFVDSTFAVDFLHFEIRKRYVCCWRTESLGPYTYFGYVGIADGKKKLIVYRVQNLDGGESRLMRCTSNNLNASLSSALCNNTIYEGKKDASLLVEEQRLKITVGKNFRVINLGGIGYGL